MSATPPRPAYLYLRLFMALGNWVALALFLVLYSYQVPRMKKEERVLEQAFSDVYRRYKSNTWSGFRVRPLASVKSCGFSLRPLHPPAGGSPW
jgi:hypothetical protein